MNISMNRFGFFALVLIAALPFESLRAQPTQLSEAGYPQQTAGLLRVVENFDGMPLGTSESPLQLANGRYYGHPDVMASAWCLLSQCLTAGFNSDPLFADFPEATTLWSGRIIHAGLGNVLEVTVVGNGGTQVFRLPRGDFEQGGTFVGFHDPQGLQAIQFNFAETVSNYSFDDIETAAARGVPVATSVPVQSPLALACLVLSLLAVGTVAINRRT